MMIFASVQTLLYDRLTTRCQLLPASSIAHGVFRRLQCFVALHLDINTRYFSITPNVSNDCNYSKWITSLQCFPALLEPFTSVMDSEVGAVNTDIEKSLNMLQSQCGRSEIDCFSLRPWLYLLTSKLIWMKTYDAESAIKLCKSALSLTTIVREHNDTIITANASTSRFAVCLECQSVRMETLLLLADIAEHEGRLSKSLDYLAEARSQTLPLSSLFLSFRFAINFLRVCIRVQSSRINEAVEDLLLLIRTGISQGSYIAQSFVATLKQMSLTLPPLAILLQFNTWFEQDKVQSIINKNNHDRFLSKYLFHLPAEWGLSGGLKSIVCDSFENCTLFHSSVVWGSIQSIMHHFVQLRDAGEVESLVWQAEFDRAPLVIQRSLRRRLSLFRILAATNVVKEKVEDAMEFSPIRGHTPTASVCDDWYAFILLASSCFPSLEQQSFMRDLVHQAVQGVSEAVNEVKHKLVEILFSVNRITTGNQNSTLCIVSLCDDQYVLLASLSNSNTAPRLVALRVDLALSRSLEQWKRVQIHNQESLQSISVISGCNLSDHQKQQWWKQRESVDRNLDASLQNLQSALSQGLKFVVDCWIDDFDMNGNDLNPRYLQKELEKDSDDEFDRLVSQFGKQTKVSNVLDKPLSCCIQNYDRLKLVELRQLAKKRNLSSMGKKADIVKRLVDADGAANFNDESCKVTNSQTNSNILSSFSNLSQSGHIIFLLDEFLHDIPIESFPQFRKRSCSRMPSLALLLQVSGSEMDKRSALDLKKCWYAVDIENNLVNTRKTMESFFSPYQNKFHWKNCIGWLPDKQFIRLVFCLYYSLPLIIFALLL
jgi:hypothetical protein